MLRRTRLFGLLAIVVDSILSYKLSNNCVQFACSFSKKAPREVSSLGVFPCKKCTGLISRRIRVAHLTSDFYNSKAFKPIIIAPLDIVLGRGAINQLSNSSQSSKVVFFFVVQYRIYKLLYLRRFQC